jgi:DNA-binding YbaB/EbfC family protein
MKNLGQMLKQAQAMQSKMAEMNDRLAATDVEGAASGGLVRVILNGKCEMKRVAIDPKAVDPSDVAMLEDLLLAAYKDAKAKADALAESEMKSITGGMALPGGLKLPF